MGVHCGFSEQQLDDFSYLYFKDMLRELGLKLNYEGITPILGNAYVKDAGKLINEYNPMNIGEDGEISVKKAPKMTKSIMEALMGQQK